MAVLIRHRYPRQTVLGDDGRVSTPDLFPTLPSPAVESVGPWAAWVEQRPQWLTADIAQALHVRLVAEVPWVVHRIRIFGRWVDSPRLSCWMGDADAVYRYSGQTFSPAPWHPAVQALLPRLASACGSCFNSVLLNRYRNGGDAMGWHSDDEPELGPEPVIASLSLGEPRRFLMRLKADPRIKAEWRLGHGDLLVMRGDCQRHAQHALPRMARVAGERINLTFRSVVRSR